MNPDLPEIYFEVQSCLGRRIRTSANHWKFITGRKHPNVEGKEVSVQDTLRSAECVRISQDDPDVLLYYKRYGKYYLCVVCRHLNGEGYIITIYFTDRLKEGHELWQK